MTSTLPRGANGYYKHEKINSKTEIRILELHPQTPESPESLHGELIAAKLSDNPSYEAISYAWGEPIFSETLHLPTGQMGITANLAAALKRFRLSDRKRRLWADALCINQGNNEEKGHQVTLMADVYRNAKHVLAWLGEGSGETSKAIDFLHRVAEDSWKCGVNAECPWKAFDVDVNQGSGLSVVIRGLLSVVNENEATLRVFFNQAWFKRLWVVQEVGLASQLIFYNGCRIITQKTFAAATMVLHLILGTRTVQLAPKNMIRPALALVVTRWREQRYLQQTGFVDLILLHRRRDYTNDLDLVYALLGLARRTGDIHVEVDYTISIEQLLVDFTIRHLESGRIGILRWAGKNDDGNSGRDFKKTQLSITLLPTWVADYRLHMSTMIGAGPSGRGTFKAATAYKASFLLNRTMLPLIGIQGTILDITTNVLACSDVAPADMDDAQRSQVIYSHLMGLRKSKKHGQSAPDEEPRRYPTGEDGNSAFARTLLFDGRYYNPHLYQENLKPSDLPDRWLDFEDFVNPNPSNLSKEKRQELEKRGNQKVRARNYLRLVGELLHDRTLFETRRGYFGVGPCSMEVGDIIVTFDGAETPYVLRRVEETVMPDESYPNPIKDFNDMTPGDIKERYELIGPCYLHGFMDNEVLQGEYDNRRQMLFIQ